MEQFTVQLNNATCTVCIGAGVLGRAGAPRPPARLARFITC